MYAYDAIFGNLCAYMQELVNKIFGKSGRIGKNYDEPAILNMFPKFALVAVGTHLSLLANVPLPSSAPFVYTSGSFSRRTKLADYYY